MQHDVAPVPILAILIPKLPHSVQKMKLKRSDQLLKSDIFSSFCHSFCSILLPPHCPPMDQANQNYHKTMSSSGYQLNSLNLNNELKTLKMANWPLNTPSQLITTKRHHRTHQCQIKFSSIINMPPFPIVIPKSPKSSKNQIDTFDSMW